MSSGFSASSFLSLSNKFIKLEIRDFGRGFLIIKLIVPIDFGAKIFDFGFDIVFRQLKEIHREILTQRRKGAKFLSDFTIQV